MTTEIFGGYNAPEPTPRVSATIEQISAAGDWLQANPSNENTRVGQVWGVIRARGMKKGDQVTVLEIFDDYYMGQFQGKKAVVRRSTDGGEQAISENCLNILVKDIRPYWAI